jgi:hypothetical protein
LASTGLVKGKEETAVRIAKRQLLAGDIVIVGVRADPDPQNTIFCFNTKCAVMQSDAHGKEPADTFQMQRRM